MRRAYQVEDGLFPVGNFTAEDWRKQRWGYYRMVEKVDGEIGKVLGALRQAGAEEHTLVIFTSDHGDCTGAHRFNQKTVLYGESVRIPLIVSWKGKTVPATSDKLINTGVDILPTVLAAAGIEPPAALPGREFLPLALGQPVAAWRQYVVAENGGVSVRTAGQRRTMAEPGVKVGRQTGPPPLRTPRLRVTFLSAEGDS